QRIKNAAQIADLRGKLAGVADKVEKSKQAKMVETVRKPYLKLETARNTALAIIFDEVRYFYPYRDRMRDYAPVQHEVDEKVKAVREAWADTTNAKVRMDSTMEKLLADADKYDVDIRYREGDASDLMLRVNIVRMYIGKDLSVQTFFENQ